ncbi:response regulator transcription factor [Beijerinckia indica]|uniref:Two component transcriptional regulator, winged helix family n=1 Tax=Beijerinckia indica subsp. indica (strain ATCC 9039 / DSM 1715 / NCIMB 8712) TaxID=395963 RepID=B2IGL3_BEII9|nr:response regulator transcription factor [Beijerinckia indica]ACB95774.1 two component transcriptional regulator, winged helix family [Beijerinckia indica subsp. indica ATCC 9039]
MRVLIVEDEDALGSAVRDQVRHAGHATDWFKTLQSAQAALDTTDYDLLLLDLGLPDGNGLEFLKAIRRSNSKMAILVMTAHDQISDRIAGLSEGADDYIVKPFDLDELIARIDAVYRRYAPVAEEGIKINDIHLDLHGQRLTKSGVDVELTAKEWAILELLARRPGMIISKERIEEALYGFGEEIESNAIEVFVSRIRKKVGRNIIRTVRGRGYCLAR